MFAGARARNKRDIVESAQSISPDSALTERAELALDFGRLLFRFGASTQRIIDSMELLYRRMGGGRLEVLVAYDAITVTASEGARLCTEIDASREVAGTNIHGLGQIRRMLAAESDSWTVESCRARIAEIANTPEMAAVFPWKWLAAGAASAGFCAFNGGDAPAIGIAAVVALVIFAVRFAMLRKKFTVYLATLGSVCIGGLMAATAARLGWSRIPEVAFVAPVLFLVPGVPMITGGIDIARNHNSVGLARIAYTLTLTATLALGLAFSIPLIAGLPMPPVPASHSWATPFVGAAWGALAAAGLALINNGRWRAIVVCALCGASARLVREGGVDLGLDIAPATLLAAVATTLLAIRVSRWHRMPSAVVAVMGCLTLIPGYFAIVGARAMFDLSVRGAKMPWPEAAHGFQMLLQAVFIAIAIIFGIIFTSMAVERAAPRV